MPFNDNDFARVRPFLYHLTAQCNIDHVRSTGRLHCAALLMERSGDRTFLRRKRTDSIELRVGTTIVSIRDQQPLYAGNTGLHEDWSFEDFIQLLNQRVFFWAGNEAGPNSYGQRHFQRYLGEGPAILRASTCELFQANPAARPQYCRYNSGSPRCSNGTRSPRGPTTFVACTDADYAAGKVVEVTFEREVILPPSVEFSGSIFGPWRNL
jgi:hypothetical protein